MPLKTPSLKACPTIGIDIGKNTFHLIGFDKMGAMSGISTCETNSAA
jgi:hypothetical protein